MKIQLIGLQNSLAKKDIRETFSKLCAVLVIFVFRMKLFNRNMILYKTLEEIEIMREAAQVVSRTLGKVAEEIRAGITPKYLDALAEDYIRSQKSIPGFLGLYGCPSTLLISVNEQVVHGLPTDKPLEDGDIVNECYSIKIDNSC